MSHSNQEPIPQFAQLSTRTEFDEASMLMAPNGTETTSIKKRRYLNDETIETIKLIANNTSFSRQIFILFILMGIFMISVIIFTSITSFSISCIASQQSQDPKIETYDSPTNKIPVENLTQISTQKQENFAQNTKQKQKISQLNIKMDNLESEVKKLQSQLQKQKTKPKEKKNESNRTSTNLKNREQNQVEHSNETTQQKIDNPIKLQNPQKPQQTQNPKFSVRSSPRKNIPPAVGRRDFYEFTISIETIVKRSPIAVTYTSPDTLWSGIKRQEYQRAIRLLEVVHNVNFKGEIILDHYKFYNTPQDKYNALSKILKEEKDFYDKKYEINKYIHQQIGICVGVLSFNNAKNRLYLRNLDSLFQQQYQNYHVVYVNDASTDGTGDYVKAYMEENEIPKQKYVIINNQKKKGSVANNYMVAHEYCNLGQLIVLVDGDDALIGRQVFSLLNAVYQKQKVALTYGLFLMATNNDVSGGAYSGAIPYKALEQGRFRKLKGFYSSHLKTMYVDVMRAIKASDLQYENGTFYDYASDVALMTSAIELVGTRLKFLKELNYEYRFNTGINDLNDKQIIVKRDIFSKPGSNKMESMPFADNPKTVHYP